LISWLRGLWQGPLGRTSRTPIAELAPGKIVKIVGRAYAVGAPIVAPFTGRLAATLRVNGARLEARNRGGPVEVPLDDVDHGHVFYVEDETGVAAVERSGWSTLRVPGVQITDAAEGNAALHIEQYFGRYGQERRTFFDGFQGSVIYREWVVPEGATVAVLGAVEPARAPIERPSTRGAYRDAPAPMALVPPGDFRIVVSTDPRHAER